MKFGLQKNKKHVVLAILRTVKLSRNVLDTHLMNLEAFIVEYSPKL